MFKTTIKSISYMELKIGKTTLHRTKLYAIKNESLWIECKLTGLYSTLWSSSPPAGPQNINLKSDLWRPPSIGIYHRFLFSGSRI